MNTVSQATLLITSVPIAGAAAGLLAGFSLLLSTYGQKSANRVLGVFLLLLTITLLQRYLSYAGIVYQYPQLQGATQYLRFLLGPCLYLYIKLLTDQDYQLSKKEWWHAAPALISLLAYIPVYLLPVEVKQDFIGAYLAVKGAVKPVWFGGELMKLPIIWQINTAQMFAFLLHWGIYSVMALLLINRHSSVVQNHFSSIDRITLRWLKHFVLLILVLNIIGMILKIVVVVTKERKFIRLMKIKR